METSDFQDEPFTYPDPETELAEIDGGIYYTLLQNLNDSKIAYNLAMNQTNEGSYRTMVAMRYFDILKNGNLLEKRLMLRPETYAKRPRLALLMEHAAYLTIDWLILIESLNIAEKDPNFRQWANIIIQISHENMRSINLAIKTAIDSEFAKNMPRE